MKFNRDLLKLMEDLNKLNPYAKGTSYLSDWIFNFAVSRDFSEITLFDKALVQEEHNVPINRKDFLEETRDELESWDSALQSVLWSVNELLSKESL